MQKKQLEHGKRATHFKETRRKRLFEIAEDYTELIDDLLQADGKARVCDIAREMGISHVSVLNTIRRLIRDGYITKNENQLILLTPKGKKMAIFSKRKHCILSDFFRMLGVPEHILATDVEGIEHHISQTTLDALEAYMQKQQHTTNTS